LQNKYFNGTLKGIVIGIFTIVLVIIISFAYKKIEAKIAKKIQGIISGKSV